MLQDTLAEFVKIMKFLRLPFEMKDLAERLKKDFSRFQRRVHVEHQSYYSPEQLKYLLDMLSSLYRTFEKEGRTLLASIVLSYLNEHSAGIT